MTMVAGEQVAGLTINRYFAGLSCSAGFCYCLCYLVTIDYWYRRVTLRLNQNAAWKGWMLGPPLHHTYYVHVCFFELALA